MPVIKLLMDFLTVRIYAGPESSEADPHTDVIIFYNFRFRT